MPVEKRRVLSAARWNVVNALFREASEERNRNRAESVQIALLRQH